MGHTSSQPYALLQQRLHEAPQGAPASPALEEILRILLSDEEARLVAVLPLGFFTLGEAAAIWAQSPKWAERKLISLAERGIVLDVRRDDEQAFIVVPTMAGFFEMALMRTDVNGNHQRLSELFHRYITVEDGFLHEIFAGEPAIGRTFVQEAAVPSRVEVLDHERASEIIRTATCITVGTCYCRHKMRHLGQPCGHPEDVCMTFNKAAESLARHGIARSVEPAEARDILAMCIERDLVQLGDNVRDQVNWVCNCCSCCCEGLNAYRRLGYNPRITSSFVVRIEPAACRDCGVCLRKCPVDALSRLGDVQSVAPAVDRDRCIGCGVCVRSCPARALTLERRSEPGFVPKDTFERVVLAAIEKGRLQNLLFDNRHLWTHRTLRRLLGVVLSQGVTKQALAVRQLRSHFLGSLTFLRSVRRFRRFMECGSREPRVRRRTSRAMRSASRNRQTSGSVVPPS